MASYSNGVNPLRPYYIPPSIGDPADVVSGGSAGGRHMPAYGGGGSSGGNGTAAIASGGYSRTSGSSGAVYSSKARDLFGDLDYKDYISEPSPSVVQSIKDVVDDLVWRYTSVLMAQPFEVARTILQVRHQGGGGGGALDGAAGSPLALTTPEARSDRLGSDPYGDFDSDPDEPSYFSPGSSNNVWATALQQQQQQQRTRRRGPASAGDGGAAGSSSSTGAGAGAGGGGGVSSGGGGGARLTDAPHQLLLQKPDSILEVLAQLWQKEGAWGVWKGTNASFVYTVLQALLESWSRSLLSALFNVPDLGLKDDVERLVDIASPYPWASLCVAATAAVATGLILAPLDLVRTRLIVTPTGRRPRRVLAILRSLPSYACAPVLVLPTALHALVHPLLTLSAPLVLRTRFLLDRSASPVTFSVAKFCASSLALLVKLPLETVLRRGQAAVASSPAYVLAIDGGAAGYGTNGRGSSVLPLTADDLESQVSPSAAMETLFPLGPYRGVLGTMAYIVREEGTSAVPAPAAAVAAAVASPSARGRRQASKAFAAGPGVAETVYRRGQGMEGLWRGWKVSWWGLVGLWTAAAVGGGGDGEF